MSLTIVDISGGGSVTIERLGKIRESRIPLSGEPTMRILSGDGIETGPGTSCLLRDTRGGAWVVNGKTRVRANYFDVQWMSAQAGRTDDRFFRLPPPVDQFLDIMIRYVPSVAGLFYSDLRGMSREWLGPFWESWPESNHEIVPVVVHLEEGSLVGSVSGVGGFDALHRLSLPGAWYEVRNSDYLARALRDDADPDLEHWMTVELACKRRTLIVERAGGSRDHKVVEAEQGFRFRRRSDGSQAEAESIDGDDVAADLATVGEKTFTWIELPTSTTPVIASVIAGEGVFSFDDGENGRINLRTLVDTVIGRPDLTPEQKSLLFGMRMYSGVAENESTMFESILESGSEARAEVQGWMRDVQPDDEVRLFALKPPAL